MPTAKPTPTQRFNRFYEKIRKRHIKFKHWEVLEYMSDHREVLKWLYETGYKQGLRDAEQKGD